MTTPAAAPRRSFRDRALLIVTALALFVGLIALAGVAGWDGQSSGWIVRPALVFLVAVIIYRAVRGIREDHAARAKLNARADALTADLAADPAIGPTPPTADSAHAQDLTATPKAPRRGLHRADVYILLAVVLVALFWSANARRYSVTHYVAGETLVYQRTDHWTGRAELYVIGGTPRQPRPAWLRLTGR